MGKLLVYVTSITIVFSLAFATVGCSKRTPDVVHNVTVDSSETENVLTSEELIKETTRQETAEETLPTTEEITTEPTTEEVIESTSEILTEKQTESVTRQSTEISTEKTTQKATVAPTETNSEHTSEQKTINETQSTTEAIEKQTEKATTKEEPTTKASQPTIVEETTAFKPSIYDYPFDVEAIRQEMIKWGEAMGLEHCEYDLGDKITPDGYSWLSPAYGTKTFSGERLKNKLKEFVETNPMAIERCGGGKITWFCIYTERDAKGNVIFYFIY